jgi:hypothetical protein
MERLVLFTRAGCCLCEGLEERLRALSPPLSLRSVDVDGDPALQARYGMRVPVLALSMAGPVTDQNSVGLRELPMVPPRLSEERLAAWLGRQGAL